MYMYIFYVHVHVHTLQDHPYAPNIFKVLEGPSVVYKKLDDYTAEELKDFPEVVKVSHL